MIMTCIATSTCNSSERNQPPSDWLSKAEGTEQRGAASSDVCIPVVTVVEAVELAVGCLHATVRQLALLRPAACDMATVDEFVCDDVA